ncbi:MAG: PD-(D/E)XK nuclease family protein [Patescibacteria group bacterium]|nr:PD-(D/E)XK nuclease family protein [Patescibacteria group bacterium]
MNNILTASRMNCAMTCLRKHFWIFEVGLQRIEIARALRIGSAWARAMEARWNGSSYEEALVQAIPEGIDLEPYDTHTVSALLAAYYDYFGQVETCGKIYPEVEFESPLEGTGFICRGKIDGLGSMQDGQTALIESKTTSDSVAPESDFWLRLSFNLQVYNYIVEARKLGWDVNRVYYDVTRKPVISPKKVYDLDSKGRKIVLDQNGTRIFATKTIKVPAKGKTKVSTTKTVVDETKPRQSEDKERGWTLKSHIETPEEFSQRLYDDCRSRPEFYFCRREIPVIDQQLESFERQRLAIARLISSLRENENGGILLDRIHHPDEVREAFRDPEAWPRNVSEHTCNFCPFKSFCLLNVSIDINNPPDGFEVRPFNPELSYATETTNATDATNSADNSEK